MAVTQSRHVKVTMDDGTVLEASIDPRDSWRYDIVAAKHGWPLMRPNLNNDDEGQPMFLYSYLTAACALVRQRDVTDTDPAKVLDRILNVEDVGTDPVNPTEADHGDG